MADAAPEHDPKEPEVVDAEIVEEPGTDLAASSPAPPAVSHSNTEVATLWNTHDPEEIIAKASKIATALDKVIKAQGMTTSMGRDKQGKDRQHVNIEAWQTAGTLLGLQAVVIDVRRIEPARHFEVRSKRKKWGKVDGKRQIVEETENTWTQKGWSYAATAEVRTMDGRVISRAEASCTREESKWMESDDYAVKSMAQTRSCSKALRQALGFIIGMAGYQTTPAEEMDGVEREDDGPQYGPPSKASSEVKKGIAYLLGAPDKVEDDDVKARADALLAKLEADADGYLPKVVGRAVLFVAADLKAALTEEQKADTDQSESSTEGDDDVPF